MRLFPTSLAVSLEVNPCVDGQTNMKRMGIGCMFGCSASQKLQEKNFLSIIQVIMYDLFVSDG